MRCVGCSPASGLSALRNRIANESDRLEPQIFDEDSDDEDGYLYIVDRKKEMILVSGINVYPREIDEHLHKHPAIHEAATIGVPDGFSGEAVKCVVASKPGAKLTTEELDAYCRASLVKYKVPRQIQFVDALPKTAAGKIDKLALKKIG